MKKYILSKSIKLFAFLGIPLLGISCSFAKNATLACANDTSSVYNTANSINHEGYTPWEDNDSLPDTAGDYILETDVTLTNTWTVPTGDDMNLCLNGHVVQGNSTFGLIQVPNGANFTLTDCNTTTKNYFTYNHNALWQYIPLPTQEQIDAARDIDDVLGDTSTNPLVSGSSVISFTGGVLTQGRTEFGGGVRVEAGGTFTMDGGNIVGNEAYATGNGNQGGGVYTYGTFNFDGGYIAGCGSGLGSNQGCTGGVGSSGVNATFTQDGGTIAYCYCKNQTSGAARIVENSTYNLKSGSIVHCSANYVGGVHINGAKFNMTGGSMSYNTSISDNGTIAIGGTNSVVRLVGGSVCNNTHINAGGVATNVSVVTIGGSFVVDNNFLNDGTESNFYLKTGAKLSIGEGEDVPTSLNVGITTQTAPTGDASVILTSNGEDADKAWFTSDNINYHLEFNTDHLELAVHKHDDHVFETNWTSSTSLPTTAGSYFLSTDVTLSGTWTVPNGVVDLCLCGHVINQTSNASVINVPTGGTLNLFNCEETPHYFTYYNNAKWAYIATPTQEQIDASITISELDAIESPEDGIVIKVTGGVITGGNSTAEGGAIYSKGALTMNNCNVIGNKAKHAGAVIGFKEATTTELNNCIVCGNQATNDCGGVYGRGTPNLILNNCNISYNTSTTWIGGVGVNSDNNPFTGSINNCLITHNKTTNSNDGAGAGIHINTIGTMTVTDTTITNNSTANFAGGADFYKGSAILKNTTITNNKSSNGNGGVYLHSEFTSLTLGGTTNITDNEKGNLYIAQGKTITIGTDTYAPAEGMSVGISTETVPVKGTPVRFTSNGVAGQLEYFSSDNSAYSVNFNDSTSGDEHFELIVPERTKVTKPAADTTTFTYTGEPQTYNIVASEFYTVTGNVQTSAGTHTVTVSLNDKNNYEWADGTTDDLTYNFVIGIAENAITNLKLDGWTYGDTPNTPICTPTFGGDKVVYTYSDKPDGEFTSTVPTNVGTYYVKAEVVATSDYKGASQVVSFTIAKKQETKPTITNLHYDKDKHMYVAGPDDPYTVTDKVTTSGNKEIHNITVSLKDKVNCCWADGSVEDLTFTKEIVPTSCNLHWIMLGILVLEIILFVVLYLLFKFKLASIISLGAGTVASIVFFIIGKCNLCYIFATINIAICIAGLAYIFLKHNEDDEKEEPERANKTANRKNLKNS